MASEDDDEADITDTGNVLFEDGVDDGDADDDAVEEMTAGSRSVHTEGLASAARIESWLYFLGYTEAPTDCAGSGHCDASPGGDVGNRKPARASDRDSSVPRDGSIFTGDTDLCVPVKSTGPGISAYGL